MFVVNPLKNAMIPRNNLAKLFTSPTGLGDFNLLTSTGGAATHAYFQYQHLHLHHNNVDANVATMRPSCVRSSASFPCFRRLHSCPPLNNGSGGGGPDKERNSTSPSASSSSQDAEIKAKLDIVKERLLLNQNEYFNKYKDKFEQMERTSPRELLAKLEQLESRLAAAQQKPVGQNQSQTLKVQPYSSKKDHFLLNDVMELNRIKDLEREDIIFLWQEFHRKKEGLLAAVMSGAVCEKMTDLAASYPMFLLPLPREHGYEFLFVQYMNNAFHFTPLIAYQAHKENAPECFRLIKYTDLKTSKDLVLMRGEFDKNLMTTKDAHILSVQINFYYGETSDSRKNLLESFSRRPGTFQHQDLIEELKKLQLSHPHLFEFDD